jgi:hypothetical protein
MWSHEIEFQQPQRTIRTSVKVLVSVLAIVAVNGTVIVVVLPALFSIPRQTVDSTNLVSWR